MELSQTTINELWGLLERALGLSPTQMSASERGIIEAFFNQSAQLVVDLEPVLKSSDAEADNVPIEELQMDMVAAWRAFRKAVEV